MANILELSSQEAHDFLMASENYCTTELPEYIDFSSILKIADERTQNMDIHSVATEAAQHEDVNRCVLSNKDGGYGIRPLTLAPRFSMQ